MENTPLDELLADALELCAKDFPRAKQKLDAFNAAFERIDERDEHGNLTRAAHDARQYLRSDLLDMRPYQRAKKEVEKQRRKAKAKAETAIAQALAAYVIYKQWDIEAGLLSDKDDGTRLVPKSREDHTRDGIARIAEPFVQDMIARGVTPAAISRRRSSEADVIAQLIQSAHEDPKYEDPDNPWVAIYRSGHIDAYRTGVTEDEARLLDAALALRDEEAAEALEKARAFLPDGLTVSTGVALGAARIMQSTSTLSDGLAQAYADAHNLVRDKDAEQLGRLLGIDTEPGLVKLQVLLNFLRVQSVSTHPPLPAWVEIDVMRRVIDTQNAHVKPATEWVGKVTEKLGNLAEVFGSRLSSEDAFYALLSAAMHSSFTYRHFENEADIRAAKDAELNRLRLMRGAVLEGRAFKIDGFGFPVCEDEEGFDELDAEVYQALVLDEQDGPKGETNSDRSAGETPAYSASNAQDQRLNPVLVPILEFLMRQEALIIEVGGNRCPMFRGRSEDLHAHFPISDGNRINEAMDLRLAHPDRVAILEFEPALYTDTLRIAKDMISLDAGLLPTIFYVCARHEADPLYERNALANKIDQTFICQQAAQCPAAQNADRLVLPWLDRSIMEFLWAGAGDLQTSLEQCRGSWTLQEARLNLEQFYKALVGDR